MQKQQKEDAITACMFAVPALIVFSLVVLVPFIYGFYLTLTDWNGVSNTKHIIGLSNYIKTIRDVKFWQSMWLTLRYVVCTVALINIIAFALAYLLTSGMKGQNFFRTGFFTPNLIGGVVLGFIWQFIFSRVFVSFGKKLEIAALSTSWLSQPTTAFWALVLVSVWQLSGYMMLIYIAGFTGMSKDVLEAASIDGATGWKKMRHIILPLMVPSIVICVFMTLSRSFMVYDINLTLTGGEPYGSSRLVAMHVYEKAFTSREYGIGQAEALFLFIIVAVISSIQVSMGRKKEVAA